MTNFLSDPFNDPFPDLGRSDLQAQLVSLVVLVAEDNPVNAKVLKRRLEKSGHTVCVAVDGQECLDIYAADVQRFDVVLMDLQVSCSCPPATLTCFA
jgi:PleD family two-component response regulator